MGVQFIFKILIILMILQLANFILMGQAIFLEFKDKKLISLIMRYYKFIFKLLTLHQALHIVFFNIFKLIFELKSC